MGWRFFLAALRYPCQIGAALPRSLRCVRNRPLKPRKLVVETSFDIGDVHVDHPVTPLFQPGASYRTFARDGLSLVRVDQLDRDPVHEGDEIRNMPADWRLALEPAGEAAVAGQGLPKHAL